MLSGWVLVLLKLLLATVSAGTGQQQLPQSSTSSVFPPGVASRKSNGSLGISWISFTVLT